MQSKKQLFNTFLIILGAGLLLYDLVTNTQIVWFKIAGLVILMIGLYTAMKNWVGTEKAEKEENTEEETEDNDESRGQD